MKSNKIPVAFALLVAAVASSGPLSAGVLDKVNPVKIVKKEVVEPFKEKVLAPVIGEDAANAITAAAVAPVEIADKLVENSNIDEALPGLAIAAASKPINENEGDGGSDDASGDEGNGNSDEADADGDGVPDSSDPIIDRAVGQERNVVDVNHDVQTIDGPKTTYISQPGEDAGKVESLPNGRVHVDFEHNTDVVNVQGVDAQNQLPADNTTVVTHPHKAPTGE